MFTRTCDNLNHATGGEHRKTSKNTKPCLLSFLYHPTSMKGN